ncbi:MAG: diguanylate cyclase [Lachnospiraceae bacterium]|nr:diguanylate cyclase [Lachnospiraceae bacterium]
MGKAKKDIDADIVDIKDSSLNSFDRMNNSIKYNPLFHRIVYLANVITAFAVYIAKLTNSSKDPKLNALQVFIILAVFFVIDFLLYRVDYFMSRKGFLLFRFIEITVFEMLTAIIPNLMIVMMALCVLITVFSIEYLLYDTDFDKDNIFGRRVYVVVIYTISVVLGTRFRTESEVLCYFLVQIVILFSAYTIVDMIIAINEKNEKKIFSLTLEVSDIQDTNKKLIEYQEKIESTNEQINYQRIEMQRTNKELAQVNKETEAQTKVMSFMASTFDISKCIEVLTDSIMETKLPKLCAIYTEPDEYINKRGNFTIKTNYTSVERRLRKEIEKIYSDLNTKVHDSHIYTGTELERFDFIGDANINSVAILPLAEGKKLYGLMIVASDKSDFFEKGLNYYEASVAEFNISVKNSKLYLMMQDMAHKDGLTGINNRMYFMQLFDDAVKKAKRKKSSLSVALYDIDKFKTVNDTYGHLAGDAVIKTVASIGNKYAEDNGGFVGRYGGEEFLIVLPDKSEKEAFPILEAMHEEIKNTTVRHEDSVINVNVCIGLTSYPNICAEPSMLINRADMAMYYGKEHGRGRLVIDDPELIKE